MPRRRLEVSAMVAVIGLVLVACGGSAAGQLLSAGNQLKNPGFEDPAGPLSGWTREQRATGKGNAEAETARVHGGRHALRLVPNAQNAPFDIAHGPLAMGQGFPAGPFLGQQVHVSGWMAANGNTTAVIAVYGLRRDGGLVSLRLTMSPGQSGVRHDVFAVPNDAAIQYVIVNCTAEGTTGFAIFDDVYLGLNPPDGTAASTYDPGPVLSADVTVEADQVVRDIPRTLYGTNLEWVWDGNGLWDPAAGQLRPELVTLARDMGTTILRFPGGVFSDFYHWRKGIGPQSQRPNTLHARSGAESRHSFGTDEAEAFASKIGAELLVTVNAGTGTAAEAADWVRYLKGRTPPVRYWEIGNELYVNDPQFVSMPPDEYARRVSQFVAAMRAADPAIRIGAISDENFGRFTHAYGGWIDAVLKVASAVDFIAVHNAYAPVLAHATSADVRTVYRAMLAAPQLIRQNLDALSARLDQLPAADAARLRLAVTEWGPLFQLAPGDPYVDHVKTQASAVFAASVLKTLIESPRVDVATSFKLVDALFMGWIGLRDGKYVPKAPYYAQQLFARGFGDQLVRSTAHSPTFDSTSVGWVPAVAGVPLVEAVASRTADRSGIRLVVINKHFDRAAEVRCTVNGMVPRNGRATTLSAVGIDANTGTELFQAPGVTWAKQASDARNPRFDKGGPAEVSVRTEPLRSVGASFTHTVPALSVTLLELDGRPSPPGNPRVGESGAGRRGPSASASPGTRRAGR